LHSIDDTFERIRLRPTAEADLPFVLALEQDSSSKGLVGQWSLEEHKTAFVNPDVGHWIIESDPDHTPLGYIIALGISSGSPEINLRRIVVSQKGRGVGRQALHLFHRMAFERYGATKIRLVVRRNNEPAKRLYLSEGYKEIGVTPKNKSSIMTLDLEHA
jgi:RimJ/RimL family protein N-acetyltransferase